MRAREVPPPPAARLASRRRWIMSITISRTDDRSRVATVEIPLPCPPGTTPLPERRPGAPLADLRIVRKLKAFAPWGTVVNAATAYPLTAVDIRARGTGKCSTDVVGEDRTDRDGAFRIRCFDDVCTLERLTLLALDQCKCVFELQWGEGHSAIARCPVSGSTPCPIIIPIPLTYTAVALERWADIGRRLVEQRIARVNALAHALIAPTGASMFGDMDLETRHSVLIELEQAFLDPDGVLRKQTALPTFYQLRGGGLAELESKFARATDERVGPAFEELQAKVESYRDLLEVDWVLDPGEIARGNVGIGLTKFADAYADAPLSGQVATRPQVVTDLGRYRDYLRTISTGGTKSGTYAGNQALLKNRFQQTFEGYDTAERPANEILIPIVKAI